MVYAGRMPPLWPYGTWPDGIEVARNGQVPDDFRSSPRVDAKIRICRPPRLNVGEDLAHGDSDRGEPGVGAGPEGGGGGSSLVGQHLATSQSGVLVDGGVHVAVATSTLGVGPLGAALHTPAAAVGDAAELLDVDVHQVAGTIAFVAAHRAAHPLAGGQVHVVEAGQPPRAPGSGAPWTGSARSSGRYALATAAAGAQPHHLAHLSPAGLVRAAVWPAGPVAHPGLAEFSVAGNPPGRGGVGDLEAFGGATQREALPQYAPAPGAAVPPRSTGHYGGARGPPGSCRPADSSTPHSEVFLMSRTPASCPCHQRG